MKGYAAEQIRNVAVVAHGGAGKTTLVEAMLYNTGAITRFGRVEDGTTTADYHPEEIKRKFTIHTSVVPCEWQGRKINFLDTPGYADFIADVKGALRVTEAALFVVCAVAGVEVQTEVIWDYADEARMPRLIFINKLDRENANFDRVLADLKDKFKANFVPFTLPIGTAETFEGLVDVIGGQALIYKNGNAQRQDIPETLAEVAAKIKEQIVEAAAEANDDLLAKYLEGEALTEEEIRNGLREAFAAGKFIPVLCGSAVKNIGVELLMQAILGYAPLPSGKEDEPLSAIVFKTLADPYVGKMNFIRVFTGVLSTDTALYNSTKEKTEKIGQIFYVRGKNQQPTDAVPAGDIAVLSKLQDTGTGDTLCSKEHPVELEGISFPEPTLSVAIAPQSKGDEDKLSNAISRLLEEEPTVRVTKNTETKETILTAMGEMQLDIIQERLKKKYGVDVVMKPPKTPYRETIRTAVKVEGKYKKQTGGRGQYGHVWLRLEPYPEGEFSFGEEVFGGAVPSQYFPAVEKGVREAMMEGVLAGYPVTGVSVVLYDGSYHPVDSSELAFKIAASMAFKKGMEQAKPVILEPIMNVEVLVPENFMGDVISDLNTKRGRILGMEPAGKVTRIRALVPLAELTRYAVDLKALTQGRASFRMEFSSYEEVPAKLAEDIIKKAREAQANEGK
ncbi:MAG: elongation factor G [Desulfotomaculales bacterium]